MEMWDVCAPLYVVSTSENAKPKCNRAQKPSCFSLQTQMHRVIPPLNLPRELSKSIVRAHLLSFQQGMMFYWWRITDVIPVPQLIATFCLHAEILLNTVGSWYIYIHIYKKERIDSNDGDRIILQRILFVWFSEWMVQKNFHIPLLLSIVHQELKIFRFFYIRNMCELKYKSIILYG